jgi:hypothetical protein
MEVREFSSTAYSMSPQISLRTVHIYRISKEWIDAEGDESGCIWDTAPVFALTAS